jgi:hypothetical protein
MAYGWIERPNYDDDRLFETIGYVTSVWVEQENDRDQLWFTLRVYYDQVPVGSGRKSAELYRSIEKECCIYLDVGTTVALAQLQLLRDALASDGAILVRLHFSFHTEDEDESMLWVYLVRLEAGFEFPALVSEYFDADEFYTAFGTTPWYVREY